MTPFATTDDLAARWRPLTAAEEARAEVLIADASSMIRRLYPDIDERIAAGAIMLEDIVPIVCAMVKRVMLAPADLDGVEQRSQATGPHSVSDKFSNPMGNMFLTGDEKDILSGIEDLDRAFTIDTTPSR
jgi:hypothetical protein